MHMWPQSKLELRGTHERAQHRLAHLVPIDLLDRHLT